MNRLLLALVAAGLASALALPALAQPAPPVGGPPVSSATPPLPALSPEQSASLDQEMERVQREVDDRIARGELQPEEAQRLLDWRRWQLARQIAGLAQPPAEPPRIVAQRDYAAPPPPTYYGAPYYGPYYGPYYAPPPRYYYYGPRVSLCAGGFGHHAFGSICF